MKRSTENRNLADTLTAMRDAAHRLAYAHAAESVNPLRTPEERALHKELKADAEQEFATLNEVKMMLESPEFFRAIAAIYGVELR